MNTIKFSKISNLTTEQHNLEITDMHEEELFGQKIKMYSPCNLNIFITNSCPYSCNFCINNKGAEGNVSDRIYYDTLLAVLNELKNKNIEITITGGEPTVDPDRFRKTMELCHQLGFKCRTVSTTGFGFFNRQCNAKELKNLAQEMLENEFTHNINISRMAIDQEENEEIFNGRTISNDQIKKLAFFFKTNDAQMRVSCNLMRGHIGTMQQMLEFVSFYKNLGIDTVMFRELVGRDDVKLENILIFNDFKYVKTLKGIFYDVDVYTYKDMLVKYYKTNKQAPKDVIASLSLKNGILCDNFKGDNFKIDLKDLAL